MATQNDPGAVVAARGARNAIADGRCDPDSTAPDPAPEVRRLRRQRLAEALCKLGPRPVFEFVDEICRHHPDVAEDLDRRLARYAGLDPAVLAAVGADRFPPPPVHLVRGRS